MHEAIQVVVEAAINGEDSSREAVEAAFAALMDGEADAVDVAALLTSLAAKGESIDDLAGAASVMARRVTPIHSRHQRLLDTCGTGGDFSGTYNISTGTSLVLAGAGVPVAKHGNRAASGSCGAADVLEALGVLVELPPEDVERCINGSQFGLAAEAPTFTWQCQGRV